MKCDVCGSEMTHWFLVPGDWRKPEVDCNFDVVRCPHDGFGRIAPTPVPEVLRAHYDISEYYTHRSKSGRADGAPPLLFKVIGKLASYVDKGVRSTSAEVQKRLKPGARVLDIGAGGGDLLRELQGLGYDVVGVEPDANAASLKPDFGVPVYQGTGEAIPDAVARQRFDMVICSHVMEHTTSPIDVMRNIHDLLKPEGIMYVEVPNAACLDFHLSKLNWQHLGVPRHLLFWTDRTLVAAARQVEFAAPGVLYRHYARQLSYRWASFGFAMIPYYREKGAYRVSPKQFTGAYYTVLLALTAFLPARLKYDSVILIATRKD